MNDFFKARNNLKVGKKEYVIYQLDALEKSERVKRCFVASLLILFLVLSLTIILERGQLLFCQLKF